jgi:hypothetical protein
MDLASALISVALLCTITVVLIVTFVTHQAPAHIWRHNDVAYWRRWLEEVCYAADVKPHINHFDNKLTIYETQWEAEPAANMTITSIDCTMTWRDGKAGPRTLAVLLTNTHTQLPGYLVMETATAIARELTGGGAGVVIDLAAGPAQTEIRPRMIISGGYGQPRQWSMRIVTQD